MKFSLIHISFILFLVLITSKSYSQKKIQEVVGRTINSNTKKPVEYATIAVYKSNDSTLITGCISNEKGYFVIEKLPSGNYYLLVSSLGYKNKSISNIFLDSKKKVDLGEIYLDIDIEVLDEVVVSSERNLIELKPNKKVVYIDKSTAASGGSAAEALEIVPQIQIEGNHITLKNHSFKVLLNGRPSGMTSDQLFNLPASNVQRIEVITNPSVKYNPEGIGGIVNIITKKKVVGLNGIIQASGGTDNSYNSAGTVNYKKGKTNLFATANINYYGGHSDGYLKKSIYTTSVLNEDFAEKQKFLRYNFKAGLDYDLDSLNLITLFWAHFGDNGDFTKQIYSETTNTQTLKNNSEIVNNILFQQNSYNFSYKHLFKRNETFLTLDAVHQANSNTTEYQQITEYTIPVFNEDGFQHTPIENNRSTDIKMDFNYWLNEKMQFEIGINTILNQETDKNSVSNLDSNNNEWVEDQRLKNTFIYNENIFGNYFLLTYANKKINLNIGLRSEYTQTKSHLENQNKQYSSDYFDLFPSAGITYSINEDFDIGLSYSRRIERPYAFQLNPFVYPGDFVSERIIGNPFLKPSYSNSLEFDISKSWDRFSINADISYLNGSDIIDKLFYLSEDSLSVKTWDNISKNSNFSIYSSLYWKAAKWCKMYLSGTLDNENLIYDNTEKRSYFNYNFRYTIRFYLKKNWSAYVYSKYYSPINYYASKIEGGFRIYLGISKTINNKLTFSLKLNDLTNKKYIFYSWGEGFESKSYTNYYKRSLYIGLLYKFGGRVKTRAKTYLNTKLKMSRD